MSAVAARLSDGVVIWGVDEGEELSVLCVENLDGASASTIAALKRIADRLSLALIHWCRCRPIARTQRLTKQSGSYGTPPRVASRLEHLQEGMPNKALQPSSLLVGQLLSGARY